MTVDVEALGKRAIACAKWRWMGGMFVVHPASHEGGTGYTFRLHLDGYVSLPNEYPDFTDPATFGCLIAIVRGVWPDATTNRANFFDEDGNIVLRWAVHKGLGEDAGLYLYSTEAEALVAVLEDAQ